MKEVLAFDWGTSVVGIMDIATKEYIPYTRSNMANGAARIFTCAGTIVSFNGKRRDIPELSKILKARGLSPNLHGNHDDMITICSTIRWPPKPNTPPILGQNLSDTFEYFYPQVKFDIPQGLDDYLQDNWTDCYKTALLWESWKQGRLQ